MIFNDTKYMLICGYLNIPITCGCAPQVTTTNITTYKYLKKYLNTQNPKVLKYNLKYSIYRVFECFNQIFFLRIWYLNTNNI